MDDFFNDLYDLLESMDNNDIVILYCDENGNEHKLLLQEDNDNNEL